MAESAAARERRIGLACALLLIFVWAGFHVAARLGSTQHLTPWDMGALRMGGAFLGALLLLAWFRPPRLPLPREETAALAEVLRGMGLIADRAA